MPDVKIKKDGQEYGIGVMPQHYPADRVYLDGNTSKTVQDRIVEKTGDTMTGDLTLDKQGTVLKIRASGSRYSKITSSASGSDKDIVLPNKSGTIALTEDVLFGFKASDSSGNLQVQGVVNTQYFILSSKAFINILFTSGFAFNSTKFFGDNTGVSVNIDTDTGIFTVSGLRANTTLLFAELHI